MTDYPIIDIDPLAPPPPRVIGPVNDGSRRRAVATPRPKGVHTKHLTELERFRVRTLYYDATISKGRIRQITGYSASQIRTAVRAKSAAITRRPGRPKKPRKGGNKSSDSELLTPGDSEVNAELVQQAQAFFAQEDDNDDGEDDNDDDDGDDDDDDGKSDDEGDDIPPSTSAGALTPSAQASTAGLSPLVPEGSPSRHQGKTFSDLPSKVRIYIWQCTLSTSPTQVPPSRSWALAVLPVHPWLELGSTPPDIKLENPPWDHYVGTRHMPATALTRVNHEARAVVLDRCTPVVVSKTTREASNGIPPFIWIDRYSDMIHFFGERFEIELFEKAGKSACPELYR
ncbi:hypothetical protein GGR58DRAFT_292761 [Xylaria digitata]|nr:hypothetical protein GGR58DRAFT_292761 [Xylaria digitata]